jgi:hypothetical protein
VARDVAIRDRRGGVKLAGALNRMRLRAMQVGTLLTTLDVGVMLNAGFINSATQMRSMNRADWSNLPQTY